MRPSLTENSKDPPRTLRERLATSLPVVMTVVATILAGASSGEMTRAQYYRAMAAQQQSKVSDQWSFFQAKRIRATSLESTVALLPPAGEVDELRPQAFLAAALRVRQGLDLAEQEAARLLQALATARPAGTLGSLAEDLQRSAEALRSTTARLRTEAGDAEKQLTKALNQSEALRFLDGKSLPCPPGEENGPETVLFEILKDIHVTLPDHHRTAAKREPTPLLLAVSEGALRRASEEVESQAVAYEDLTQPTTQTLRSLETQLTSLSRLVRQLHRASADLNLTLRTRAAGDSPALSDIRLASAALLRIESDLRETTDGLSSAFKAAHVDYTARRYNRESQYNRFIAGLYELQVRHATLQSERHRQRSARLFYAMLAAQAGVTIATLSLATRQRNMLWLLSGLAGLSALSMGAYGFSEEILRLLGWTPS